MWTEQLDPQKRAIEASYRLKQNTSKEGSEEEETYDEREGTQRNLPQLGPAEVPEADQRGRDNRIGL